MKNRPTAARSLVQSPGQYSFLTQITHRILLVADNYGSHHAKLTQQRANELGIEFVFIPPYSPTLNAIEPLWKSLKQEISPEIYKDEEHFRQFLTETFLRLSHRLSFAVDWIETFLPDVQMLR